MWYKFNIGKNILNNLSLEQSYVYICHYSYLFLILQFNDVTI